MRVRLLGGLAVDGIAERDLGSRKGRTLLKVLALARGAPVPTGVLADVLWGDDPPARPNEQVGVLASRLRAVLGAGRLPRTDAGYALVVDWLDVEEVERLTATAAEALDGGRVGAARAAADAALGLVRGPLLPDEDGPWVDTERAAVDAAVRRVRSIAVDAASAAGDHDVAAALAEAALAHDPYDEVVLRSLMRAHVAAGRPASALAAYARTRARLVEDLGVSPTADTEAAHAAALLAADSATAATPAPAPPRSGLTGRDPELARLDDALEEVRRGATQLVSIEGEPGIGKSTLLDHWTASVAAVVLRGRCDELGRDLPLQPVADALAAHLGAVGAERAATVVGPDADTLAPILGPVAGSPATVVADNETGRARLFAALAAALTRAAVGAPLVVVIEDLHAAGASTRGWLAFARHRCPATLFVVTSRTPTGFDGPVVRLGPLDLADVTRLVGEERAGDLHARSGGHPLLLAALVAIGSGDPAETVRDAVARWAADLGADASETLRLAAVLGAECDLDLIAQVRSAPVVDVLGHLESAAGAGLLVERGPALAFRNELVRSALASSVGAARRALVHRDAARALQQRTRVDPLAVAVHARDGADAVLASASFVAAAEAALARFDVEAAGELLDTAVALDPTPAAFVARGRLRMGVDDLGAANADAGEAVARGGGAAALELAGWVAYYQRRYDDAAAFAERAIVEAGDPAVRGSALALAGRVRHGAGDLPAAVERLTTPSGAPPAVQGVADVWLAHARNHQGRPADALDALAAPMVDPDRLAHPWAPLHLRFTRAMALGQLGRVADGLRVVDDLAAATERAGPVGLRFLGPTDNVRGWLLRWSGRPDEADDANLRASERSEHLSEAHWVALLDLADGSVQRGDLDAAASWLDRLAPLDTWSGTMAWHQRHRLDLLRARVALAGGDPATAAALAASVAGDARARGAGRYDLLASALLGVADPSVPVGRLAPVVDGLGRCAVLDGWPLIVELARRRGVDRWRGAADRLVATVVAGAGERADDVARLATRLAP